MEAELVLLDRASIAATAAVGEGQGAHCEGRKGGCADAKAVKCCATAGYQAKGSISQQCHIPDCDGMRGRRSHSIRISRIVRMSACASDEAVVNLARRAAAVEASVGVMRLSSRGGNWGGGDAAASAGTFGGLGAGAGTARAFNSRTCASRSWIRRERAADGTDV